jgi:hypothetical protein
MQRPHTHNGVHRRACTRFRSRIPPYKMPQLVATIILPTIILPITQSLTPAIDCVAERQLMSRHSTTKSFMHRSATPCLLHRFRGLKQALPQAVPSASGLASAIRVSAILRIGQVILNSQQPTRRANAQPLALPLQFAISNLKPSTKHQAPAIQPISRNRRPAALQSISRTSHRQPRLVQHMSINHRRLHIHVPQ